MMLHRPIKRRKILKDGAAGAGTAALAAFPARPVAAAEEPLLLITSSGGIVEDVFRKTLFEPFKAATGIDYKTIPAPTLAQMQAMTQSNNVTVDLFEADGRALQILARRGLLEPINYGSMRADISDDLIPGAKHQFGIGQVVSGGGMVYSTTTFSKERHPRTWAEFWDSKQFPGQRTLPEPSFAFPPFEPALLADGVPADKLYPLDVDRAFASLGRIKPQILKWYKLSAEGANLLTSGNVD